MYFLNIYKQKGISSFDVIRILRKKLKIREIGHYGTLDPLASGVMQVGVGGCTKLLDYLKSDKIYIAEIRFGYITDTYDDEGEKKFIKTPDFNKNQLENVLTSFLGKTLQIPPKYSAIKQNGKKLYEIARNNLKEKIEIKPREIEIYSIKLLEFSTDIAIIEVYCKKGVYIRSLAYDIGQKLGCGAYIKELTRIKAGNFEIKNSNKLDDEEYKKINPLDALEFEKFELNDEQFLKISHGNYIKTNKLSKDWILLTKNNKLVSLALVEDNKIKPKKNFLLEN